MFSYLRIKFTGFTFVRWSRYRLSHFYLLICAGVCTPPFYPFTDLIWNCIYFRQVSIRLEESTGLFVCCFSSVSNCLVSMPVYGLFWDFWFCIILVFPEHCWGHEKQFECSQWKCTKVRIEVANFPTIRRFGSSHKGKAVEWWSKRERPNQILTKLSHFFHFQFIVWFRGNLPDYIGCTVCWMHRSYMSCDVDDSIGNSWSKCIVSNFDDVSSDSFVWIDLVTQWQLLRGFIGIHLLWILGKYVGALFVWGWWNT